MTQSYPTEYSAMLYAVVDNVIADEFRFGVRTENWVSALANELSTPDVLKDLGDDHYLIQLTSTIEREAMKIARLMRSAFQQSLSPRNQSSLSIGVVLFDTLDANPAIFLDEAKKLALSGGSVRQNKISFKDCRTPVK